MNKAEFLSSLKGALEGLPEEDISSTVDYYSELVDDMIEDGISEAQAVESMGSVKDIANKAVSVISLPGLVKNRVKERRKMGALEIALLILGSPIWLSLLVAVICVCLALIVILWAAVICVWAVFVSLMASSAGCIFGAAVMMSSGNYWAGLLCIGAALICAGLSVFAFYASKYSALGAARLCRLCFIGLKKLFIKKEAKA